MSEKPTGLKVLPYSILHLARRAVALLQQWRISPQSLRSLPSLKISLTLLQEIPLAPKGLRP